MGFKNSGGIILRKSELPKRDFAHNYFHTLDIWLYKTDLIIEVKNTSTRRIWEKWTMLVIMSKNLLHLALLLIAVSGLPLLSVMVVHDMFFPV